jgi:hypothetical protein
VDEAPPVAPEKGAEPGVAGQEAAALEQEGGADAGAKAGAEPVEAAVGEPPEGAEPGSDIVAAARAAEQAGQGTGAVEAGAEALVASATPGEMADATAQPVEAAEPARRTVRIESTPNGALVLEGDAELGATPLDVEVAQGAVRTIVLKSEGFKSHELELSDGSAPELDVALEKERAVRPKKTAQSSPERPAPKDQKEPAKGGSGDLSVPYLD